MTRNQRRSLLYAPADRPEKVERAANSAADAVILDLESTVARENKTAARDDLGRLLDEFEFGAKETVVRINDLRTSRWLDDLEAAIDAGADAIRLPKIERAGEVESAVSVAAQLADETPEFLIQLESPWALLNSAEIAAACADLPQVTGVGVGIGDYRKALGVPDHTDDMRGYVLNEAAAVAAAGDMDGLAYVHKDAGDLREAATRARDLGHDGQPISHAVDPAEFVPVVNEVYGDADS